MSYYLELLERQGKTLDSHHETAWGGHAAIARAKRAIGRRERNYSPMTAAMINHEPRSPRKTAKRRLTSRTHRPLDRIFDPVTGHRICLRCNTPKSSTEYTTRTGNVDGRDARCKQCKAGEAQRWK